MLLVSLDQLFSDPLTFLREFPILVLTWGSAILVALTVHEFSHALVASRLGDRTAQRLGRLSLNPIRHLDPMGTALLVLVGFGWGKPVPVNEDALRKGRQGMALVAVAGPLSNLLTAFLFTIPIRAGLLPYEVPLICSRFSSSGIIEGIVANLVGFVVFFNIILAVFNLIPLFPLDGSKVALGLLPRETARRVARYEAYGSGILIGLIALDFVVGVGIFRNIIFPVVHYVGDLLLGQGLCDKGPWEGPVDKIAIIGLGLVGGSIGMALKKSGNSGLQLVGHDADPDVGGKAARRGAVDKNVWSIFEAVDGANMVIIATPVMAIREVLETIGDMVSPGCVVTDTGSTKEAIMEWAEEYLPRSVSFIGGHPMAGKEVSGIGNADPNLFKGARYVIIPGKDAREEAVQAVVELAGILGTRPYYVDAFEHDSYVAAVSHMPILLSSALVAATTGSPAWREMSKLAATGFHDVSRLASGDPVMNLDICMTNQKGIVHWMNEAIRELQRFRDLVENTEDEVGAEALGNAFGSVWQSRERWVARVAAGDDDDSAPPDSKLPTTADTMGDFFMGGLFRDRYERMFELQKRRMEANRPRRGRPS